MYVDIVFAEKDRKDTGIKVYSLYTIIPPRLRGDSPKEIQPSNKGISFGEKGAGKRKIEAQARFDVYYIVLCCDDRFTSMKPYKRLVPKPSNGAVAGRGFNLKTA